MITISVNGESRSCPGDLEMKDLLIHLGYQPEGVVVELNGTILSRSQWSGRRVVESDALEVVTIVGGGT